MAGAGGSGGDGGWTVCTGCISISRVLIVGDVMMSETPLSDDGGRDVIVVSRLMDVGILRSGLDIVAAIGIHKKKTV
jgi:hypothetical protein